MTNTTMPHAVRMRPIQNADAAFAAAEILALAMGEDLDAFEALVPHGATTKPVEIAEDQSAAVFDLYAGTEWGATDAAPIARIIVRR